MTDYVSGLAEETFRQIANEKGPLLERVLSSSFETRPPDAVSLAGNLQSRADVQARLASLTGYTPSRWLLERELDQVEQRRAKVGVHPPAAAEPTADTYNRASDLGLMGLCFSGGGIRSATFNLGILQGLAELNLLRCFDYLSTVSGGGYIHQWFAASCKRRSFEQVEKRLIPLPEPNNPGDHPEPIRWLRRYSNYLTPEKGLLSADFWVAIATWLRNALLNQTIVISGLLFLALVLHLFTFHSITPHRGPAVVAMIGAIFYLSLLAIYFLGGSLLRFDKGTAGRPGAFGQGAVQGWIVLPLVVSALLFTLLFPIMMAQTFGANLSLSFLGSLFLLLLMALTITLAGGAPLAYLKSHQRTSQYNRVGEFWSGPKCFSHVKFVFATFGLCSLCALSALGGAAWIAGSIILVAKLWWVVTKLWCVSGEYWWRIALVVGPPLILAAPLITMLLVSGLLGRTFQDARREWLSRLTAWMGLYILLWILSFSFALFGHCVVIWLRTKLWTAGVPILASWIMSSVGGVLAAKNPKSSGAKSDKQSQFGAIEILAVVGPYVFIAGLLLLISALAEVVFQKAGMAGPCFLFVSYFVLFVICVLFAWRVDINEFSLHAFYRNRLARCYLGASNIPRHPNPFTGFDEADTNIAVSDLLPAKGYNGPFPIFCTALNLTFGADLAWQERKAASFAFTPLYSGYDVPWTAARGRTKLRFNGFVKTENYAYPDPGIHINTAAAISGAALSPNMGYHTSPATAFLLTVFSVRLGWWLRNPRVLDEDGTKLGLPGDYPRASPHFSLLWLVKELLGWTTDTSNYVYLSDGGHFDNMGLYELVRRRCRYIVICDGEDDGELKFGGIGMAIRKCRIDFGAEVALDLRPLQYVKDSQYSAAHCVVGTVKYPEGTQGVVVYIKSSLTGDEPADVLNYKKEHSSFPHDTTLNQWFTESQFESYRRLGHHLAFSVFEPAGPDPFHGCTDQKDKKHERKCVCATISGRDHYFDDLRRTWWAPTPEMERFTAAHTARYEGLLEKARTDENLPGFFRMMFSVDSDWKKGRSQEQVEYAVQFSSELIEFIWMVFDQLDLVLPEKRDHPYARGWSLIFTKWTKIDVVRDGWKRYRDSYSPSFRRFAESDCVGLPES
jgi:hypothetical protein